MNAAIYFVIGGITFGCANALLSDDWDGDQLPPRFVVALVIGLFWPLTTLWAIGYAFGRTLRYFIRRARAWLEAP